MLPTIRLGTHHVTRLICGGNPVSGISHYSHDMDWDMLYYYTASRDLDGGAIVTVTGAGTGEEAAAPRIVPQPGLPLRVLAEGPGWIAVDKPAGMPVHPLRAGETGTVLNAVIGRHPDYPERAPEQGHDADPVRRLAQQVGRQGAAPAGRFSGRRDCLLRADQVRVGHILIWAKARLGDSTPARKDRAFGSSCFCEYVKSSRMPTRCQSR